MSTLLLPGRPLEVLVTGGCGYIGSHMAALLARHGHGVTVLDNLSTGHREAFSGNLTLDDIRDAAALDRLFAARRFDVVMHFAGLIVVSESVAMPGAYYDNNVCGTVQLLEAMRRHGVSRFVFSSTAAVYGMPETGDGAPGSLDPLGEDAPTRPLNPYGHGKRMVEQILQDYATAHGFSSVCFRYFNAAGADPSGRIGEAHHPETHLIPNVLNAALGKGPGLTVFGDDYPTPDGTCLRDYIHVQDLAEAHLAAAAYMDRAPGAHVFNLGNGRGFSVLEVIEAARTVTGLPIAHRVAPRRAGDAPCLVASSDKARQALGWTPAFPDIHQIIETAWRWSRNRRY